MDNLLDTTRTAVDVEQAADQRTTAFLSVPAAQGIVNGVLLSLPVWVLVYLWLI